MLISLHDSQTAINPPAQTENISRTTNFIYDAVGITVTWIVAGTVIAAGRRRLTGPGSLIAATGN